MPAVLWGVIATRWFPCDRGRSEAARAVRWLGPANEHALEFIEGVPNALVPDQLRSAVSEPSAYEPRIQRTMAAMAEHYGTALVPARPGKARDKAKVEVGVQIAQRWILARLRNETFFSMESLNARIRELLEDLNSRPMKRYGGLSRRDLFERTQRRALRPLPETRYVCAAGSVESFVTALSVIGEIDNHCALTTTGSVRSEQPADRFVGDARSLQVSGLRGLGHQAPELGDHAR